MRRGMVPPSSRQAKSSDYQSSLDWKIDSTARPHGTLPGDDPVGRGVIKDRPIHKTPSENLNVNK